MTATRRLSLPAALLAMLAATMAVHAQSMSPMRGTVTSFSDEFALKVYPHNVYQHRILMEVRVYDQDFRPVKATVWPQQFWLAGQDRRPVTVLVSFDGAAERRVRVCAESVPFMESRSQIKAQICGKFLARRVQ